MDQNQAYQVVHRIRAKTMASVLIATKNLSVFVRPDLLAHYASSSMHSMVKRTICAGQVRRRDVWMEHACKVPRKLTVNVIATGLVTDVTFSVHVKTQARVLTMVFVCQLYSMHMFVHAKAVSLDLSILLATKNKS